MKLAAPLEPVDWVVLFMPATYQPQFPWWWRFAVRFMDPAYGHVILIAILPEANVWLVMDMQFGGLQVRALPLTVTCAAVLSEYPGATTYAVVTARRYLFPHRAIWGCNCVSLAKAVLSLQGWILTPRQLHRRCVELQRAQVAQERADDGWWRDGGTEGGGEGRGAREGEAGQRGPRVEERAGAAAE